MRFLCISDIHGNLGALERVLEEGKQRGFHQLVVCGDLLFPGAHPLETWRRLVELKAVCVQGVGDRAVASVDPASLEPKDEHERARVRTLEDMQDAVGELIVAHLGRLKPMARIPLESGQEMVVVHGAPADPTEAMTVDMTDEELSALLGDDPADLVICGASHVPFDRLVGEVRIVNVGSVGDSPTSGIANATIIESFEMGYKVEQFDVALQ